ncbi:hypothetical protein SAMN05444682_10310 [Parapedobacter indicus]|uniref:Uncharacterized protein n=1 Tax=Parapedobacter indicus TaxID=1477437 RepID=A0A1I3GK32_9SPHI|nr:hypothetical protein CLV26_10311 [Parapedobacter indicus]SFI23865.1 hypothetical protein SAMN05444682_10310 [Parapedobacter indicus]
MSYDMPSKWISIKLGYNLVFCMKFEFYSLHSKYAKG